MEEDFNSLQEKRIMLEEKMYDLIGDYFNYEIDFEFAKVFSLTLLCEYYNVIRKLKEIGGWY